MKTFLITLSIMFCCVVGAADLPTKGLTAAPNVVLGPDGLPVDPSAPTGNGIFIILALTSFYVVKKRQALR